MKKKTGKTKPTRNRYPKDWNLKRVQAVIKHYDNQTEEEAVAEDEAAYRDPALTMMAIPNELVPQVEKLIAKRAG